MNKSTCHICLQPLQNGEELYHAPCCKKLFDSSRPPALPYTWDELNELAGQIVRHHITVPGVQPKLSLHLERSMGQRSSRFTLIGLEGGYILKPPVAAYPEMSELEHLTMRLAGCFDLATADCGLIPLADGKLAYVTRRMDRPRKLKLHMEDMCQLTDRLTEQKYRGSMEQIGKVILRHCDHALLDTLRFFELTLFSFLSGNSDMHLKNFSLLYSPGGAVSLSPAYDLLPTKLLLPEDAEDSALPINGRKKKLTRKDFFCFAESLQLTEKQTINAFDRFSAKLEAAYPLIEKGCCSSPMKDRYRALIRERVARLEL